RAVLRDLSWRADSSTHERTRRQAPAREQTTSRQPPSNTVSCVRLLRLWAFIPRVQAAAAAFCVARSSGGALRPEPLDTTQSIADARVVCRWRQSAPKPSCIAFLNASMLIEAEQIASRIAKLSDDFACVQFGLLDDLAAADCDRRQRALYIGD